MTYLEADQAESTGNCAILMMKYLRNLVKIMCGEGWGHLANKSGITATKLGDNTLHISLSP